MQWLRRLMRLVGFRHDDADVQAEIRLHVDMETEDLIRLGVPAAEARRRALVAFGGVERTRAEARDVRRRWFDRWGPAAALRTLKQTMRSLSRTPGYVATAVLTLALGIGATTAVFSVVYGVLLKPLPFPEPDRLVALYHVTPANQRDIQPAAAYFTYREHGRVFEDIGLWQGANVTVTSRGTPEQVRAVRVTDGTLSLLGIQTELGRLIQKEDDAAGAPPRVVLTHAYWQQTFGGSRDVVGQSLIIDGMSYEIIGVLPTSFALLNADPQLLLALRLDRATTRTGAFIYNGIARLRPGVTLDRANDDIARMMPLIVKQFPLVPGITQEMWDSVGLTPNVRPLSEAVIGDMSLPLWILLGTVGVVLLVSWSNVANLLLIRAEGRRREFAVRGALGASQRRIAVQLLSETLMLGLAGGACGVVLAHAGIALLRRIAPPALPRVEDIGLDAVVLLVTLGTSVVTSVLFGLMPVLRLRAFDTNLLKEGGRSSTDAPERHRTRHTLVVAQVALALVLLVVSGLMARTFHALRQIEPGFARPAEVQAFDIPLTAAVVRDRQHVMQTYEQIFERLEQVPGVEAVGLGTIRMDSLAGKAPVYGESRSVTGMPPIGSIWSIGAGYFETMGNAVVAGRTMTWTDISQFKPVVLISVNLAREYWQTPANAIGKRIGFSPEGPWLEVVGVVGDVRADGLNHPAPRLVFRPMADEQFISRNMTYLVRSSRVGTEGFLRELQHAVWSVDSNVPVANLRTLDEMQAESMSQTSFAMVMLSIASGVALLLALVGIYGVLSYIATERTHEIGIRMALGAQGRDVRGLFLRRGLALTLVGIVTGIGAAMLLTPVMSALLYGVGPMDPLTYAIVAVALGAVALLATYLPARRASRVPPVVALRSGM